MLCKVGNSDPSISCIKYFLSFLVLMLTLISSVASAGTISITSVSVNPAPGPITLNNDGWAQFSMTVCYSASGFGPNDTVDICAQLCKPGSCGSGSAVIGTVKYPNGSGCVTKTVWLGGIHMRGYCGDAFINVNILCYDSVPQCHTDSRIINGYTVTCECTYSLTVSVSGSGSVSRSPNKSSYGCNETVTLTASPSQGWRFDHWGGDLSGTANPTTITMNGNKAVVAYFVSIQEVSPVNPELLQSDASSVRKTLRIWNDDEGVLYHTICPDMHIPCVQEWRSSILTTGVYPPTLELDSGIPSKTPVLVQNTLSPVNLKVSGSFFDARLYWILTKTLPNGDVQAVCSGEGEVSQTLLLFPGNYTLFAWVEFSHEWPNIEWGEKHFTVPGTTDVVVDIIPSCLHAPVFRFPENPFVPW